MLSNHFTHFTFRSPLLKRVVPVAILATHAQTCPQSKKVQSCPSGGGGAKGPALKRALASGKCRMGFIPDEWFLFFHSHTGVSGPYLFGLVVVNYMLSKEIYVMEHEYFSGLSIAALIVFLTKKQGKAVGESLDKEVDAICAEYETDRKSEIAHFNALVKASKEAQWRAEGQKLLMDAKKENIAMQLEAIYRERMLLVHRTVKGRMDYHLKRYRSEARIHQRWMVDWILDNVRKSITPELEKQALDRAIQDLAAAASSAK